MITKLLKNYINADYLKSLFKKHNKQDREDVMTGILADVKFKNNPRQSVITAEEEIPYDFAVKCMSCGELMPKEHLMTNMGKCADCTEKKFNEEVNVFLGRIIVFGLISLLVIIFTLVLFEVILKTTYQSLSEIMFVGNLFKGRAIFAFVAMACLYSPLSKMMTEKITDSKPSFIKFVVILGFVSFFTAMLTRYFVVVLMNIVLWLGVFAVLGYFIKQKYNKYQIIKRFKEDSIDFKGKIYRLEKERTANNKDERKNIIAPIVIAKAEPADEVKKAAAPKNIEPELFSYYKAISNPITKSVINSEIKKEKEEKKEETEGYNGDFII